MTNPADLGVTDAISALSRGDVTAHDLARSCLDRITSDRARALNAFIHVAAADALDQARASDRRRAEGRPCGPIDGVPIAIKDNIDVAGMPTTNGLATHWMPAADAPVIQRLRDAGMIFLGKLNMHEGALGATTDNAHHGRCMHPDFPGHTPGGSSGGSAAAVAARLCPVTLGTDTMGSVRLPAAYCGTVGFKPSRDYWPVDGVMPLGLGLDAVGPLARSVADIAAVLGEDLSPPALGDLRLAQLDFGDRVDIEPACQAALDGALEQLASVGASIERIAPSDYDPGRARRAGFIVSEVDGAAAHADLLRDSPESFSPEFLAMLTYGQGVSPDRYAAEHDLISAVASHFTGLARRFDALVTLTAPQRTFAFGEPVPVNQADLTAIANFTGSPAISLPLPVAAGARPVGLQLIAAPGADAALLSIAARIESALRH